GAVRIYRERYLATPPDHFALIENGYDEELFTPFDADARRALEPGTLTLLHSGIVYPDERDPTALFDALARLRRDDPVVAARFKIRFRAPVHDNLLRTLARRFDVETVIDIAPPIPY